MKRKPIVVLLALLLALTTVIFAACGGSTVTAELSAKDGFFTVDEATGVFSKVVDADVEEVDVLGNVAVNEGFTLSLYKDKGLSEKLEDGKAKIVDGINTFYIKAEPSTDKGEAKTFVVKITRSSVYAVTFKNGDDETVVTVTAGHKVKESDVPTPAAKPGYTFVGWGDFDFDKAPTESVTVEAVFKANTDTAYKVEHYKKSHDNKTTLVETENKTGTTDTVATASPKTYDGYKFNAKASTMSGTIAGDGSLTLKAYYDEEAISGKIIVYVENAGDNEYVLAEDLGGTFTEYDGVTYTYDEKTIPVGFALAADKDNVTEVVMNAADPAANTIKVYLARVRAEVTFKDGDSTVATKTAKYGFGLITPDGGRDAAPAITDTPSAGKEFVWADATGEEINYRTITEAVTLVKTERDITRKIEFIGFNTDANFDTDGYELTLPEKTAFGDGEAVTFYVDVNEDFNKSAVQFVYKSLNETGAGTVLTGTFDEANYRYTYTFTPEASGTVEMQGAFERNTYDVTAKIVPFGEWGTVTTLDGVTADLTVNGAVVPVEIAADGTIETKLVSGTYSLSIVLPSGNPVEIPFDVATESGWTNKLTPGYDYGNIVVGIHEVSSSTMTVNPDGSINSDPNKECYARFTDLNAGDFAVKATVTYNGGTEGDPGFVLSFDTADDHELYLALMRNNLRINGDGFDWNGDRTDIGHGISGLWTMGESFEFRAVKSANAIILYYQKSTDEKPVMFAEIANGKVTMASRNGDVTVLSTKAAAKVSEILAADCTVNFGSSVNISGGASLDVTYTNYGYMTAGYGATVTVPAETEGGEISATANGEAITGKAPLGSKVVVNVTPDAEKEIASFTVTVNGGSPVSVATSNLGTLTGDITGGYTLTFIPMNWDMNYEFGVTFKDKDPQEIATGKIVDKDNNDNGVAGASVVYYLLDETGARDIKFAETTTDETGAYSVSLKSGNYEVEVSKNNYFARTATVNFTVDESASEQTVANIELKFMLTGGSVTVGEKTLTSKLNGINTTYDYATDTLKVFTPRGQKSINEPGHWFTDYIAKDAVVEYTVKFDPMSDIEGDSNKEFWPGIAVKMHNGTKSFEARFLRFGVMDPTRKYDGSSNFQTGPGNLEGDAWAYAQANMTGQYGANSVDVRVVKTGDRVYMFSKYTSTPTDGVTGGWTLVYSYTLASEFVDTPMAWAIDIASNTAKYCYLDWENISISSDAATIESKLTEAGGATPFDYEVQLDEDGLNVVGRVGTARTYPNRLNDGWYSFTDANPQMSFTKNAVTDFMADVTVMNFHDRTIGYTGGSGDEWETTGFALSAGGDNRVLIGAHNTGVMMFSQGWTNDGWTPGKSHSTVNMFGDIGSAFGFTNYVSADGVTAKIRIIRKGDFLYFIREGKYLGKFDKDGNAYAYDGSRRTDYKLPSTWTAVMAAPKLAIGIGAFGNHVAFDGAKDFSLVTDASAIDAAIAELTAVENKGKKSVTVTDGQGGSSVITVNGAAYVKGETITSGQKIRITVTAEAGYALSKFEMKVGDGDWQEETATNGVYEFTGAYDTDYAFRTTFAVANTVLGKVKDSANAAIEGATVTLVSDAISYSATSDANGDYTFAAVAAGTYALKVTSGKHYARVYENAVTVTAGDPITAPVAELDESVFGGDVTFTNGTTVKFSSDLNVDYNYDTKALKVSTVAGKNSNNLERQDALFTGIKDAYSVVKFTVQNNGGTEGDPGMGVRYVDANDNKFQFLTRMTGARIGEPQWVSNAGLGLTPGGFSFANKGKYDVMFVRANDTYYMIAKENSATEYGLMYVSTVATRTAQGIDNAKMPSGEARVSLSFTIGGKFAVNYVFTNFEAYEGEEEVNKIIGKTHTVTIVGTENADITVTGGTASAENANVYTVAFGADVTITATAKEGYEIAGVTDDLGKNYGIGEVKYPRLMNDRTITYTVQAVVNKTITGAITGATVPTGMDGVGSTYVVFTKDTGNNYFGKVTIGEDNAMTYTASLPAGNYTKATWMNNVYDTAITVTEDGTQDIAFTGKYGYTTVTGDGLVLQEDGSLKRRAVTSTHESALSGITFKPATQKLTFSYTLTNMPDKGTGWPMAGMFVKDSSNNMMRVLLVSAGDQLMITATHDYESRIFFQTDKPWDIFGKPTGYYTYEKGYENGASYKLTMKVVIDGHKLEMYAKIGTGTNWITIYGADNKFDVDARFTSGTCTGGAGTNYIDTLFDVNKDCSFGVSFRNDTTDKNMGIYSNIWYTIEDRA